MKLYTTITQRHKQQEQQEDGAKKTIKQAIKLGVQHPQPITHTTTLEFSEQFRQLVHHRDVGHAIVVGSRSEKRETEKRAREKEESRGREEK